MEVKMTTSQLMASAVDIGQKLLECGAEIYRVEESMYRMFIAYGAEEAHIYAVPTSIIATVSRGDEPAVTVTRRIFERGMDLDRLDRLNALSRELCKNPADYETVRAMIADIEHAPKYGSQIMALAFGGIAAFFSLLFGAGAAEALVAFFTGVILRLVLNLLSRAQVNMLFTNILGGAVISACAVLLSMTGLIPAYEKVIIGSIMSLVPGLAITNSMRDLIAGDFIAGLSKFAEALMVATGIAVGVAVPIVLSALIRGGLL